MIDAGADMNHLTEHGTTALHDAVRMGFTSIIRFLISAGADLNVKGLYGTALNIAIAEENNRVIEMLKD